MFKILKQQIVEATVRSLEQDIMILQTSLHSYDKCQILFFIMCLLLSHVMRLFCFIGFQQGDPLSTVLLTINDCKNIGIKQRSD